MAVAAFAPLTLQEEGAVLLSSRVLFTSRASWLKPCTTALIPSPVAKNYFNTAWNAAVLIAIDILLTINFFSFVHNRN